MNLNIHKFYYHIILYYKTAMLEIKGKKILYNHCFALFLIFEFIRSALLENY